MLEGINILVAEDNLLNQRIVKFILNKQHAIVSTALNGQEAIDYLGQNPVDIVLMDLQMPEMDGYAATRYIRQNMKSNIPIIAVTASSSDKEQNDSLATGMNAYVSKPFDANSLCEMIFDMVKNKPVTV